MVLFTSLDDIQVAESAFMFKIQLSKLVPEKGVSYCNFSSVLILGSAHKYLTVVTTPWF